MGEERDPLAAIRLAESRLRELGRVVANNIHVCRTGLGAGLRVKKAVELLEEAGAKLKEMGIE